MDKPKLEKLLEDIKNGTLPIGKAIEHLEGISFHDLGFAKVDNHRGLRCGFPEVIFCQGKEPEHISEIIKNICENNDDVLATRLSPEQANSILHNFPEAKYNKTARTLTIKNSPEKTPVGKIVIATGGTSDIPVAEEARVTAEIMGNNVVALYDVGVAGIHRLLSNQEELRQARVVIAVAGMEGALPSVIGGLVKCPVIAVPTSIGYGASFGGVTPLLAMLNSCASGVTVVNIDNGFGAGYSASLINQGEQHE